MPSNSYIIITIAIMAVVTALIRFFPFILFTKKVPKPVEYLGKVLPFALMGMLVIYCLKGVSFIKYPYGIPEAIAIAAVALLHKWKHNTFLSIISGTVLYMVLVQVVF